MGTTVHEPGDRITVSCPTCETEQMGEIERFTEGTCWRCDNCEAAHDLDATALSLPADRMGY